jgi:hypothetical protein
MGGTASHDVLVPEPGSSVLYERATATSSIINNVKSNKRPDRLTVEDEESPFCRPDGLPRTSYGEPSVGEGVVILERSSENFSVKIFNDPLFTAQMDAFASGGPLNAPRNRSVCIERVASGSYEIAPYETSNDIVSIAGAGSAICGRSANLPRAGPKFATR